MDETVSASSLALGDPFQTSTFHTGNFLLCVSEYVWKDKETKGESEIEGESQIEDDRDMERESQARRQRSKKKPGVEMFPLWQSDKPVINIAALQRLTPGGPCVVLRGT